MAEGIRSAGQKLSDAAANADWSGTAAEQFRAHAQARAGDFRVCVSLLDEAAKAVSALAAAVR